MTGVQTCALPIWRNVRAKNRRLRVRIASPLPNSPDFLRKTEEFIFYSESGNMSEKKRVILYTDGACSGNPGAGGWGAILIFNGIERELSGGEAYTTNNRMELMAVIKGLEALKYPCTVEIYSDSAYTVNAFVNRWISSWEKNGWKKADGKSVMNVDLWQSLLRLTKTHEVEFKKVKGHADNEYNNRCDTLARSAIAKDSK